MTPRGVWLGPALLLATACDGPQSALNPAGPAAASIHRLGIAMYIAGAVVLGLVTVLMLRALRPRPARAVNRTLFLWGGGVALPLVTLTTLVIYSLVVGRATRVERIPYVVIDATARQFWWELSYRRRGDTAGFGSANELRLPAGEPVELHLRSADVIHSFWVPSLAGKTDMIPGRVNHMTIQADRPGVYRGQCAEYCGRQHALMAFDVIVLERDEFDAWVERLGRPAPPPPAAFVSVCGACHTVRGGTAGRLGPDLTLVGSRRTIGAGTLAGGATNLAEWIARSQYHKPGIAMPSFEHLDESQLRALAEYLASLR